MADFEIGLRTSVVTNANAGFELRAAARRVRIYEFGITLQAATASTFGLGRPANVPAGGTNNVAIALDPADTVAPTFSAILAGWSTAPTAPAGFFRRIGFPATIGSGYVWTFRKGLVIPVNGSIVLWNLSTVGVSDIYVSGED